MADDVLETYIRQDIEQQSVPKIPFAWQGGEGAKFFITGCYIRSRFKKLI